MLFLLAVLLYSLADLEARQDRRRRKRLIANYIFSYGEDAFIKVSYLCNPISQPLVRMSLEMN
jgi:hypothetical protein